MYLIVPDTFPSLLLRVLKVASAGSLEGMSKRGGTEALGGTFFSPDFFERFLELHFPTPHCLTEPPLSTEEAGASLLGVTEILRSAKRAYEVPSGFPGGGLL